MLVSLLFRGEEKISHIALQDRNRAPLAILRLIWLQCDDVAFKVELWPLNVRQLALANAGDVSANEEGLEFLE